MARSRWTEAARAALALLALPCLATAAVEEPSTAGLAFARHGEPVTRLDLPQLLRGAPAAEVRVWEPYEEREAVFRALPLARVLDQVYTPSWREEEEILFTCSDGYQPTLPVARVLSHGAWLAFGRADQPGFTILKQESGARVTVALAPFYLVWENLEDARLRQEGDWGWPYQLVGIELIRSRDRFPRMAPPPGASAEVQAGFAAFRVHCSRCHTLNGEGGRIGPELNGPVRPLAYRERGWLRSWIEDPSRIRPDSRMPALNPALPERPRVVSEILAYLEAMAASSSPAPAGAQR